MASECYWCAKTSGHDLGCPGAERPSTHAPIDVPFEDVITPPAGPLVVVECVSSGAVPAGRTLTAGIDFDAAPVPYCPASMMGRGCEQAKGHSGRCVFTRTLKDPDFLWRAP
jgi:hypothetical protein